MTAPAQELEFVAPILGFEDERRFRIDPLERTGTLFALQSARTPDLRFVVAAPEPFFPDYAPEVDESVVGPLDAEPGELTVLVILTVSGTLSTATANLLAPLVVAPSRNRAMQVVLPDDTLPLAAPLAAAG